MANISAWSSTAADNDAATPDGFPEGQSPGSLNDCGRELMAAVRRWYEDAQWINFGHTPTKVDSDTFTVAGDQTSIYDAGRRVRITGSASGYGTISSSSYSAPNTTVNLTSGVITGTLTAVAVGILSGSNNAIPPSLATTSSGTFTGTLTGMNATTQGTLGYYTNGDIVAIFADSAITGTSNADSMTITGMPSALYPASSRVVPVAHWTDSGAVTQGYATVTTGGVITASKYGSLFATSGTKGIGLGWMLVFKR